MYRYQIDKPEHGSQDWLEVRWSDKQGNKRVSASVAGSIYNEHPYTSAADLAAELLADTPPAPLPPTQDMERGNRMEPMLVQWVSDAEGIPLVTPEQMYCLEDNGARMIATLDAIDPNGTPYEVKTTRKRWDGELPRHWYWQGVHQAACVGSSSVEWIIFDGNMDLHRYTQVVSSDEVQMHVRGVAEFLSFIDQGLIPDNVTMNYGLVESMYPDSEKKTIELDEETYDKVNTLSYIQERRKELEQQESQLKADIGLILQDAEIGTHEGTTAITWKTQKRESFDTKAFESAHPALAQKFRKTSQFRVMKINKRSKA